MGAEDAPLLYANQFVLQRNGSEFFLLIGQVTPPVVIGTPEEQEAQLDQVSFVPVKVVARVALNRERLGQLVSLPEQQKAVYDAEVGDSR